jgi:DNA-binding PadR family transcriptional regulator
MKPVDLVQGTLDLLILKSLALEPLHGWAIAARIRQLSNEVLLVQQGSLYPALQRLEHQGWIAAKWGVFGSEAAREVLFADQGRPKATRARNRVVGTVSCCRDASSERPKQATSTCNGVATSNEHERASSNEQRASRGLYEMADDAIDAARAIVRADVVDRDLDARCVSTSTIWWTTTWRAA